MSKYASILGNTMRTIASDLQAACAENGEDLDAEGLAESAIDMVYMYGEDETLSKEFSALPFEEQIKHAKSAAEYYL